MEKVSIIVLAYNAEKYIQECLDSIINQTYKNIEVIIIDDGSKDNTKLIIENIALNDNRITVYSRSNKGTYYSRIDGYRKSTGKYIMYVDSDDVIELNMVEIMYNAMIRNQSSIVHCQNKLYIDNNIIESKKIFTQEISLASNDLEPYFYDLLYKTIECNPVWKQLYSRDILSDIDGADKSFMYGEDLYCNIKAYQQMNKITFIPEQLYIYRVNNSGITRNRSKNNVLGKIDDILCVYKYLFDSVELFNIEAKKYYKSIVALKIYYYLTINLLQLNSMSKKEFIKYVNQVLSNNIFKDIDCVLVNDKNIYKELNINNRFTKLCTSLLVKRHLKSLYYVSKYLYNPLKKIKR